MPDLHSFSPAVNLALFAVAAAFVWLAGTRLARYVDEVGARTGLGEAFLGMVMLGVATSLPEVATTITASMIGNAELVTANLFGGVAMQITVLAIVDVIAVRGALTYVTPHPVLLFQGVMLLLLLSLATAGAALGDPIAIMGVGLTPLLVAAGFLVTVWVTKSEQHQPRWEPTHLPKKRKRRALDDTSLESASDARVYALCAGSAGVILLAGWVLALTGDALAGQTGLGSSFVGVALVAASTSLPEISTVLGSVRQGNHQMAVSNILGTNCLEVALFLVADVAYRGGPMLAEAGPGAMLAAAVGMLVTCILLLGLLLRRDRTIARMGWDSLAILIVYGAGLAGLFHLR